MSTTAVPLKTINASLRCLHLLSPQPAELAQFYARVYGMLASEVDGVWHCASDGRLLLISSGLSNQLRYANFAFGQQADWLAFNTRLSQYPGRNPQEALPTSLNFSQDAIAVKDPDGNIVVFEGPSIDEVRDDARVTDAHVTDAHVTDSDSSANLHFLPKALAAELQHYALRTQNILAMLQFYEQLLGFVVSDRVVDESGTIKAAFLRVSDLHHCLALFNAPVTCFDHQSFEAPSWDNLKHWADHVGRLRETIVWGVGRHGPGNDVFFMLRDPDNNLVEISSEIEHCAEDRPAGQWPHEERTLNLWGKAIMRGAALLIPAAIASWHDHSLAQSPGDSSSNTIDEVVVSARREFEDRFQSINSRVTIGRRDIEAMGANTIGDILRQTPGLQVSTTANGGLEIRMRGLAAENTRILIDGVPVSTSNQNSQLPLDELPADVIEKIEVIRAPTAEMQGAAGGTLNIVLKAGSAKRETFAWLSTQFVWGKIAPQLFVSQTGPLFAASDKPDPKAPQWSYFLSLTAGPRNLGSNTSRTLANNAGAGSSASYTETLRIHNGSWTLTPRVTGRFGSNKLVVRGIFSGTDQTGITQASGLGNNSGNNPSTAFTSQSSTPWDYERKFNQLGLDWSRSFADAKLDTSFQLERSTSKYAISRAQELITAGNNVSSTSLYKENRQERGFYASSKLNIVQDQALWTFGGEFDQRNLNTDYSSTFSTAGLPVLFGATTKRQALWGQYELPIETIKTGITAGIRAQEYGIDASSVATGQSNNAVSVNYKHLFWQPSLNTRTRIDDTTQFRFNLARISRNPRVWEIMAVTQTNVSTNSPTAPDYQGNPNLRPQSTVTMDFGVDKRLSSGGQAGINLFLRNQSDVVARKLFLQANRWTEQPENIGDATVWGIETDVRTNLQWLGLSSDWTMSANTSLLQSRMKGGPTDSARIPGQARYLANLNIAKPLKTSGGWYGGGSLALVGHSDYTSAAAIGSTVTGRESAHAQLDLYVGSVIPVLGFWRLNLYNITNYKQDRKRLITDSNGISFSENSTRTLTPRIFLTFGTRF